MNRLDEFKLNHEQLISKELLEEIKSNYYISRHAQEQLVNRSDLLIKREDSSIDFKLTKYNINKAIDKNILSYFNTDGSVDIALDDTHYFVFCFNESHNNWTMITYKEPSWYSITIQEKRQMALKGFDRKYD